MFNLTFSEKINSDIVTTLKYISEVLESPRAAEDHYEEIIKTNEDDNTVFLYRFLYCRRDWMNILSNDLE